VWGPPRDVESAIAVLREALAAGVNHIDTGDFYGPHVANQIIKRALHPYSDDLVNYAKHDSHYRLKASALPELNFHRAVNALQQNGWH
jgi:aryl-alcohol dehydrogenase-like predicted oxidoreductase